jgi:predicted ABC-class ATPase
MAARSIHGWRGAAMVSVAVDHATVPDRLIVLDDGHPDPEVTSSAESLLRRLADSGDREAKEAVAFLAACRALPRAMDTSVEL